ncbi:MAG: hypothetical protein AAF567_10335 [Actinomycetota bacterium]
MTASLDEAIERAAGTGDRPEFAVFVERAPIRLSSDLFTGSLIDLARVAVYGLRRAVLRARERRRPEPERVLAIYGDRLELLTFADAESRMPSERQPLSTARRIVVGDRSVRIGGQTWQFAPSARDPLLRAMRSAPWRAQVGEVPGL